MVLGLEKARRLDRLTRQNTDEERTNIRGTMKRLTKILGSTVGALAIGLAIFSAGPPAIAGSNGQGPQFTRATIPQDFEQVLMFIADGELPAADGILVFGDDSFQTDIMGRTPAEIAAVQASAVQFLNDRFGIPNADNNPDITFLFFTTDERLNYRAYVVGDQKVPREGWEVRDGGYLAVVSNPAGIMLGGDFAGVHVPVNTSMVFGEYNIKRTKQNGQEIEPPIVINYFANTPALPAAGPQFGQNIDCGISSAQFGAGLAQGFAGLTDIGGGNMNANLRNVLTFSDAGGL